eukprot:1196336-Prorocentrum_minimum.AAC.2
MVCHHPLRTPFGPPSDPLHTPFTPPSHPLHTPFTHLLLPAGVEPGPVVRHEPHLGLEVRLIPELSVHHRAVLHCQQQTLVVELRRLLLCIGQIRLEGRGHIPAARTNRAGPAAHLQVLHEHALLPLPVLAEQGAVVLGNTNRNGGAQLLVKVPLSVIQPQLLRRHITSHIQSQRGTEHIPGVERSIYPGCEPVAAGNGADTRGVNQSGQGTEQIPGV